MSIRLGEILVRKGLIKQHELDRALDEQTHSKKNIGEILVRLGYISEKEILEVLSEQQGIRFVNLKDLEIEDKVIKAMPPKFVEHYEVMPIRLEGNILTIAISNPFDVSPMHDLETHLGMRVERVLALSTDIQEAIRKYYGVGADTIDKMISQQQLDEQQIPPQESTESIEDLEKASEGASVIRLVNQILEQAIKDRATDIHIETSRDELTLRYRVDGVLREMETSDTIRHLYSAILLRIKLMARLDIVERRIPQDGRARVKIDDQQYELRVSVIPAMYGENIAIRILPASMVFDMGQLGMTPKELEILQNL